MAQQTITNGEGGLSARDAINGNFTELYASLPIPIKIAGMNANYNQAIAANAMVAAIAIAPISGGPITLRIGITANGQEIFPDTAISGFTPVQAQQYYASAGTLYFTFTSGTGTLNVLIDVLNNYN